MAMTPGAWLALLEPRLDAQARHCKLPDDYYQGNHRLAFATEKFRQMFGSMLSALSVNWCRLVVDATTERLKVEGFRYPDEAASKTAWEVWQANNMDLKSRMLHAEAIKLGRSYTLVEPPAVGSSDPPNIYVEHPSQVIVAHAAGNREKRVAALKKYVEDDGYLHAILYLPDAVFKFRSQQKAKSTYGSRTNWGEAYETLANPLMEVPVVPFYNRQQMLRDGCSDLDPAIPIQDILNKLIADMVVDSEASAFVQRIVTGWDPPKIPGTDKPMPETELQALRAKFMTFKDPDVKVTELQGSNLERFVAPIGMVIQHFSAVTRMPPHYLIGQIVNASGDALKAAEAGLTYKAKGNIDDFSDPHEETQRLASIAGGRQQTRDGETIWMDPETKSDAEKTDAAIKQRGVGVPLEVIWELLGFTPQQINRMKALAGLPDRPPPGATTAAVPPVLNGNGSGDPARVVLPPGVAA